MRVHFGKFSGTEISELPSYYLRYLIHKARNPDIRSAAELEFKHRNAMNTHWPPLKPRRMS